MRGRWAVVHHESRWVGCAAAAVVRKPRKGCAKVARRWVARTAIVARSVEVGYVSVAQTLPSGP
eukprot:3224055-Pleurochrysis_carterae.AAC.1